MTERFATELTPAAVKCLKAAGWFPERREDLSPVLAAYKREGLELGERACRFLHEFDKLTITFPHFSGGTDQFVIDGALGAMSVGDGTHRFAEQLKTPLSPVGLVFRMHMIVFSANDGRLIAIFDPCVALLGETEIEAINKLCNGMKGTVLPDLTY